MTVPTVPPARAPGAVDLVFNAQLASTPPLPPQHARTASPASSPLVAPHHARTVPPARLLPRPVAVPLNPVVPTAPPVRVLRLAAFVHFHRVLKDMGVILALYVQEGNIHLVGTIAHVFLVLLEQFLLEQVMLVVMHVDLENTARLSTKHANRVRAGNILME